MKQDRIHNVKPMQLWVLLYLLGCHGELECPRARGQI